MSIADLTLTDFRIDLADYHAGLTAHDLEDDATGRLRSYNHDRQQTYLQASSFACEPRAARRHGRSNRVIHLRPTIWSMSARMALQLLPFAQAKLILDRLKRICLGRDLPDLDACARFDTATRGNEDMREPQRLLATAVSRPLSEGA